MARSVGGVVGGGGGETTTRKNARQRILDSFLSQVFHSADTIFVTTIRHRRRVHIATEVVVLRDFRGSVSRFGSPSKVRVGGCSVISADGDCGTGHSVIIFFNFSTQ